VLGACVTGYSDPTNAIAQWHPGKGAGDQTDYGDALLHSLDYCARAHANPTPMRRASGGTASGGTACTGGQRFFSFEGFAADWKAWAESYPGYSCQV
jgi:hypothetical protein